MSGVFRSQGKQNPSEILPPQTENICAIMYTSGTSGDPKGVVITHENVAYGVRGIDLFMEQFEDKVSIKYDPLKAPIRCFLYHTCVSLFHVFN